MEQEHEGPSSAQPRLGLVHWYREGARAALLGRPRWPGLAAGPAMLAAVGLTGVLLTVLVHRLVVVGPADFYWRGLTQGWLVSAVMAWVCYLVRPQREPGAPGAAELMCMTMALTQVIALLTSLLAAVLFRTGFQQTWAAGQWQAWLLWLAPLVWAVAALLKLLVHGQARRSPRHHLAGWVVVAVMGVAYLSPGMQTWYPERPEVADAPADDFELTQELMEAQPGLLAHQLQQVPPQRPGVIDVYAVGFAPYADEDVFRRESGMVMSVMRDRFDARGGGLQLLNHRDTATQAPWATPLNLQRVLRHLATVMDRDEDIVFLHLTSHGARDGELAAEFWPMTVAPVVPAQLKAWLDEAGIRHRVISISACYSGSWIQPLADEHTLVVTAADAHHTSYGCGRGSELTFFGRAMYDEQLRRHTLSFEQAHAAAREVIRQREVEAGKQDGYSNPQIHVGARMQAQWQRLLAQLGERDSR